MVKNLPSVTKMGSTLDERGNRPQHQLKDKILSKNGLPIPLLNKLVHTFIMLLELPLNNSKERFILHLCSRTKLPPVLDDINKSKRIEKIAVVFYNRGKKTCLPLLGPLK